MKILILMQSSILTARGGAEVQAEFIRQACVNAGHEVHFVFDSKERIEIDDRSTYYHMLPGWGRLGSYLNYFLNYFALSRLIRKIKPDLIYQRVRFSYTGIAAYLAKRYGSLFVHNISADYACQKNTVPFNRAFISLWIREFLGRYGIKHSDLLIAQTKIQAKLLRENFRLESIVIPNGHPVPEGCFEKSTPPVVAWVANIKAWKQPEIFIELARRLSDTKARFVMAGKPARNDYQEKILRKIDETPNVEYLGQLSLEEVNSLLSRASIFVNTSQPREGFPNTFIQAWMRQTPVVTLNFDPDDINTSLDIGFLSGEFCQLERDVIHLLRSPDVLKDMGYRARRYCERSHDIRVIGSVYLREFEKLLTK